MVGGHGKADPFLSAADPFAKLPALGQLVHEINSREYRKSTGRGHVLPSGIFPQGVHDLRQQLARSHEVAGGPIGRPEVGAHGDPERNVLERLGDGQRAPPGLYGAVEITDEPEVLAHE